MPLDIADFKVFFNELYGEARDPYSWQTRLVDRALVGDWPGAIDLPTGSGKTACIDIALFALACQTERPLAERLAPRRIFFCVNRRVIVDEAYERARRIARRLWEAESKPTSSSPILREVARCFRALAGTSPDNATPPLDVLELRGGIYRDNRWTRSATQPTVICSTIDQIGSRLLFRGYGVSPQAAPIQAALIAYDSLLLLDEAHISQPFRQTLDNVSRYLDPQVWAEQPTGPRPMTVVPMTATPPPGVDPDDVIRIDAADRHNEFLRRRLQASKPAFLEQAKKSVVDALVSHAQDKAREGPFSIGIIVNRVASARAIYEKLRTFDAFKDATIELVIGAMRPVDRDEQTNRLVPLIGPDRPEKAEKTSVVIATQCLEVGADYDFDVLLTECASLDAVRQRFGRLNRAGRPIEANAVIVIDNKQSVSEESLAKDDKKDDPIYGKALSRTWNWLWEHAEIALPDRDDADLADGKTKRSTKSENGETRRIDFGIDAFEAILHRYGENGRVPESLLAPSATADAPVMMPAYVDFWCQTSPVPVSDPDVALFLHGRQHGEPDVQVCWRSDLVDDGEMTRDDWCDVVALVPPSSAECMSVPISRVRRWLAGEDTKPQEDLGDLLEVASVDLVDPTTRCRSGILWRGVEKSQLLQAPDELRPGDTLVLPLDAGGWDILGHIPKMGTAAPNTTRDGESPNGKSPIRPVWVDVAETAFMAARDRCVLRLHPTRFAESTQEIRDLLNRATATDDFPTSSEIRDLLSAAIPSLDMVPSEGLQSLLKYPFACERYPDNRGFVLISRRRLNTGLRSILPALDDGEDNSLRIEREEPISLADHTQHVLDCLKASLGQLPIKVAGDAFELAAQRHDWGKIDERFQALLLDTDCTDAWLMAGSQAEPLAKSIRQPRTPQQRNAARLRSGLPLGFRHEMLSLELAELDLSVECGETDRGLILHLIAAHHGHARPFAPVVIDDDPPDIQHQALVLNSLTRKQSPPHRLDSGIADRFWTLTRRFGWWGLAYLEALLRLADQQASACEDAGLYESTPTNDEAVS